MTSTGANAAWPGQPQQEQQFSNMDGINEQDFSNLIDFEQFDFLSNYDPNGENAHKIPNGLDLNMLANAANHSQHGGHGGQQHGQGQNMFDMQMQMNFDSAQHSQGFPVSQNGLHMQQHPMVPSTPNSVEMHGDAARYLQQMDAHARAILEQQLQMRKNDIFTPLGTPAVTPHEGMFNNQSEYTVPGAYFSPLVSPALEGQQQQQHGQRTSASTASTASPVDLDIDMLGDSAASKPKPNRKTRRQSATSRSGRKVAQSPIQKPMQQKRKSAALSSVLPPKEVTELLEMHAQMQLSPTSPNSARLSARYPSSSDSISPEPLSEGLMGPPPKPHSAKQSPAILASHRSPNISASNASATPATPASLMRIQSKEGNGDVAVPATIHEHNTDEIPMLDDLLLPEAAAPDARAELSPIDTSIANGDATPKISARKGPRSGTVAPESTPSTTKPTPAGSPISGVASPVSSRRPEMKSRLSSKKRGSVSSMSPALRPKISPSIKPLLPEGASLTEEAHALLLMNRSNYQNLIEGTNIPGVTFPSDLPSQLTSKRTSHKLAEQGRRQRINVALQEMQGLLPKSNPAIGAPADDDDDDDEEEAGSKKKGGKGNGNSKAATVESAIKYIRIMQKEEARWKQEREEVEALRKELNEMKTKLEKLESDKATKAKV